VRSHSFFGDVTDELSWRIAHALERRELAAGEVLVRQGEAGDDLYLVETGELRALVRRPDDTRIEVGRIRPGEPVGEMQLTGGGIRTATVEAVGPATVFRLARGALELLSGEFPAALAVAREVTRMRLRASQFRLALPAVFGPLDRGFVEEIEREVEWVSLAQGEPLFRQGDACDGWYLVLTGRLRVVTRDELTGEERAVREVGHGETLGEVALLTGAPRTATPWALRDSLVARFPVRSFETIMERHPRVLLSITRTLIGQQQAAARPRPPPGRQVIAVVPASGSASAADFIRALAGALAALGPTLTVDARGLKEAGVLEDASRLPEDHPSWLRFSGWLEDQQSAHAFVVLVTDPRPTGWSRRALGQADHVVVVADAREGCAPGPLEAALLGAEVTPVRRARRTLVLVHPADTRLPSGTDRWLAVRHVDAHGHVKAGSAEDAARLARLITGRAVGLALGGGGARGYAHLGVVKALRELGVPIDVIGGTSMGAIMAGQLSLGLSLAELFELNYRIMAIRPFREYTVPMVAMLKTSGLEQSVRMAFGETRIEDLWLPYFAVSSNLTTAEMVVHEAGPAWAANRASCSLPGIAVPVVVGPHLLVDGGVVNNLPGDVMRVKCGGGPVIAVDVSPEEDVGMREPGFPSPWRLLWNRLLPAQKRIAVPGIIDILMRTTMLASAARTAQVKRSVDLYLRPPTDGFGMLEFERMEALVECGYRYTLEAAAGWRGGRPPAPAWTP
jgi:NTE family protein/lysophospholipid hydrolase